MLWMLVASCGPPGPGELGYVECEPYDARESASSSWTCEPVEYCSRIIGDLGSLQWFYRLQDGTELCCHTEDDCADARTALTCTVCEESDCVNVPEVECDARGRAGGGDGGNGGNGGGDGGGGTILCNDGTFSPSCTSCTSGCCSGHGGCE